MNDIARRGLLKLLGALPALPMAANRMLSGSIAAAIPLTGLVNGSILPLSEERRQENERLGITGCHLRKMIQTTEQEAFSLAMLKINGCDPDISAMKSWSQGHKALRQSQRDRYTNQALMKARALIWGE